MCKSWCSVQYYKKCQENVYIFFNVGPPKEDFFSGHLLCPIFQENYSTRKVIMNCLSFHQNFDVLRSFVFFFRRSFLWSDGWLDGGQKET